MLSSRSVIEAAVDHLGYEAFRYELAPPETFLQSIKYYVKRSVRWAKAQLQSFLIAINLKRELTDREKIILSVENALNVEREKDSDVINVTLRFPDPNLAVRVVLGTLQDVRLRVRRHCRGALVVLVQVCHQRTTREQRPLGCHSLHRAHYVRLAALLRVRVCVRARDLTVRVAARRQVVEELRAQADPASENLPIFELIADQSVEMASIIEDLLVTARADLGTTYRK